MCKSDFKVLLYEGKIKQIKYMALKNCIHCLLFAMHKKTVSLEGAGMRTFIYIKTFQLQRFLVDIDYHNC